MKAENSALGENMKAVFFCFILIQRYSMNCNEKSGFYSVVYTTYTSPYKLALVLDVKAKLAHVEQRCVDMFLVRAITHVSQHTQFIDIGHFEQLTQSFLVHVE